QVMFSYYCVFLFSCSKLDLVPPLYTSIQESPTSRSLLFPYTTLFRSSVEFQNYLQEVEKELDHLAQLVESFQHEHVRSNMKGFQDRKSTRLNSSHVSISYAVFCLKKKRSQIKDDQKKDNIHTECFIDL